MARQIWKFPIAPAGPSAVPMPYGADVVRAALDGEGQPCVWALVEAQAQPFTRYFAVIGTGQPLPDGAIYIGTFELAGEAGVFVGHVFEVDA